jgi:hypothetical protein
MISSVLFVIMFMKPPQQPQEDADLQDLWQMDRFSSLRQDFLSYIKAAELAAER